MSEKPEVEQIDPSDPRYEIMRHWPTRKEAHKLYSVAERSLERWFEAGLITKVVVDGVQRFNPQQIEAHATKKDPTDNVSDALHEVTRALKQSQAHTEGLIGRINTILDSLLSGFKTQTDGLREECETLRRGHLEAVKAREESLTEQATRNMIEREQIQSDRRKDSLLQFVLTQLGPHIASKVTGAPSLSDQVISKFDREDLETLVAAEILSAEQNEAIRSYIAWKWPEPVTTNGESQETKVKGKEEDENN